MWNFASHAGAGVAIAGISATYYAWARKNNEMEREHGYIMDSDGDKRSISLSSPISQDSFLDQKPSHSLLKNELNNISRSSGHSLGLNIVSNYQTASLEQAYSFPEVSNQSSGLNLHEIVSRVQTDFERLTGTDGTSPRPENEISLENRNKDTTSTFPGINPGSETKPNEPGSHASSLEDKSRSVFDVEEFSSLELSKDSIIPSHPYGDGFKPTKSNQQAQPASLSSKEKLTIYRLAQHKTYPGSFSYSKSSNLQSSYPSPVLADPFQIQRTKSPIIYYKNPEFGKRFACKISSSVERLVAESMGETNYFQKNATDLKSPPYSRNNKIGQAAGINLLDTSTTDDRMRKVSSDQDYKDSTQFLFPPVLSESKLSLFEEDLELLASKVGDEPLQTLRFSIFGEKERDDQKAKGLSCCSQIDEIRDYNLQLGVSPLVWNTFEKGSIQKPVTEINPPQPTLLLEDKNLRSSKIDENRNTFEETEIGTGSSGLGIIKPGIQLPKEIDTPPKQNEAFGRDTKRSIGISTSTLTEERPRIEDQIEVAHPFPINRNSSSLGVMQRIPAASWISFPARLYSLGEPFPYSLAIFLALVTLVFGIMGKFFIELGTWIQVSGDDSNNEDEYNSMAMMEH